MFTLDIMLENFTNGYKSGFINLLSFVSIILGIFVIITRNPIVSVLFLIGLFCIISSYLITLGMHFLGLSYLLVYVGAISILFLFILMLINVRISELATDTKNSIPLAIFTSLAFSIPIYSVLPFDNLYILDIIDVNFIYHITNEFIYNNIIFTDLSETSSSQAFFSKTGSVTSKTWDGSLSEVSHITSIGNIMYTGVFIWLIVTSLILLLAMVGAIVITIRVK